LTEIVVKADAKKKQKGSGFASAALEFRTVNLVLAIQSY
jgi:hypothetical protein